MTVHVTPLGIDFCSRGTGYQRGETLTPKSLSRKLGEPPSGGRLTSCLHRELPLWGAAKFWRGSILGSGCGAETQDGGVRAGFPGAGLPWADDLNRLEDS